MHYTFHHLERNCRRLQPGHGEPDVDRAVRGHFRSLMTDQHIRVFQIATRPPITASPIAYLEPNAAEMTLAKMRSQRTGEALIGGNCVWRPWVEEISVGLPRPFQARARSLSPSSSRQRHLSTGRAKTEETDHPATPTQTRWDASAGRYDRSVAGARTHVRTTPPFALSPARRR